MKISTILVFTCLSATSVFAQEESAGVSEKPAIKFQVLEQKRINLGTRSIFLNRVVPPVLPELPPPPPPPTAEQIAAAQAEWERLGPHKKYEILFLSATVYDRKVTEVRWFGRKGESKIFSNIDFNYLRGAGEFETEDTVYMLLMGIGDETSEQVEGFNQYAAEQGWPKKSWKQIPKPETFSPARSEYMVMEDAVPLEEDLAAMDALHVYFDTNKQRLIDGYNKLEVANAERAQWLKEHPPIPKDTIINFWQEEPKNPRNRSKMEFAK